MSMTGRWDKLLICLVIGHCYEFEDAQSLASGVVPKCRRCEMPMKIKAGAVEKSPSDGAQKPGEAKTKHIDYQDLQP